MVARRPEEDPRGRRHGVGGFFTTSRELWRRGRALTGGLADLLLPPICLLCGELGVGTPPGLCDECAATISLVGDGGCPRCGAASGTATGGCRRCRTHRMAIDQAVTVGRYTGSLREAILGLKYGGTPGLARPLGWLLEQAIRRKGLERGLAAVTAVPLHPRRRRARGYNQALLIAEELASGLGVPARSLGLIRSRETPPQAGSASWRVRREVIGAFRVRPSLLGLSRWRRWKGYAREGPSRRDEKSKAGVLARCPGAGRRVARAVLLVDDVVTSGATAHACALALRKAGVLEVRLAAVATSV